MLYRAMEGTVPIDNTDMDYVAFGRGQKNLILIPGLGDGLRTVKGTKFFMAYAYRLFAQDFRVYVLSRKNELVDGYSTLEMARDLARAMGKLALEKAYVIGISQGGMIAQHLTIDFPAMVEKLVLGVSISRPNETMTKAVETWIEFAKAGNYRSLIIDTMEKTYSEKKLKRSRFLYPLVSKLGKPKSFERFITQARACLNHDAYERLPEIQCPTLIIAGEDDKIVGKEAGREMAARIKQSRLISYKGLGHGAYEEAKDFNRKILDFFLQG